MWNYISFFIADVYIDVPDTIDLSNMRSKGLQPSEELLPDGGMYSQKDVSFTILNSLFLFYSFQF